MVLGSAHRRRPTSESGTPGSAARRRPRQAELLRAHGIRLDKKLGQHFLVDPRVPERIAAAVAELAPDRVVELASGAGALTFVLLDRGWPVTALELDGRMIELLRSETEGSALDLLASDLAKEDFTRFVTSGERTVFAGNLPYQVTSPVLFGLLPALRRPEVTGAVLMVQAEVAQRMVAAPGGKTYGVLSVLLQAQLEIETLFGVAPGAFLPPPDVDSAVVRLRPRRDPVELGEAGTRLVKELFAERRKQIGGLLRRRLGLPPDAVEAALGECDLEARQRAETLTVDDFARLSRAIAAEGLA